MTRPLSLDLRKRIAAALSNGASARTAAKRFDVSVATAVRIGQKARAGRGLAPGKIGGHRPFVLRDVEDWLRARLAAKGDVTTRGLVAELAAERGVLVTHDTVWRCLRRLGLSFKKNSSGHGAGWTEGGAVPGTLEEPPAQA